jgi:hypothetical protein
MECENVDWYQLTQERIQWQVESLKRILFKDAVSCQD